MSELPKGWVETDLGSIALINEKIDVRDKPDDLEVTFLPMGRVDEESGAVDYTETRLLGNVRKGYTQFIDNDVIFAKITPCMENGKVAVVSNLKNGLGYGSTEFHVIRFYSEISPEYIFHFLVQKSFRFGAERNMRGAVGQKRVPPEYMVQSKIPLPPLAEQKRIVEKIEALFSRLDAGIAALEKTKAQLKRYKISLINKLFMPHIENESRKELNMVADVISGFAFKSSDFISDSIIPVIKIANVGYGNFEHKQQQFLPSSFIEKYSNFKIEANDILLALTRPITNNTLKICKYPKDEPVGLLNQRVAKIKPKSSILIDEYFIYYTNTEHFKSLVKDSFNETLQPNMSPKDLKLFKIPTPSIEIQQKTVTTIQKYYSTADKTLETVEQELKKAQALKSKILEYAFTGKLVPQKPDDEPAEKLLERIKAEKEASKPTKKTIKRK